jgi:hypothetical protein
VVPKNLDGEGVGLYGNRDGDGVVIFRLEMRDSVDLPVMSEPACDERQCKEEMRAECEKEREGEEIDNKIKMIFYYWIKLTYSKKLLLK